MVEAELRSIDAASRGRTLARERVRGPGLERIFAMASELARKLRDGLSAPPGTTGRGDLQVSEMTDSVEAFRHYSRGLEESEQFLPSEALHEYDQAIAADPTFAPAHLARFTAAMATGDMTAAAADLVQARKYAHKLTEAQESLLRLREAQLNGDGAQMQAAADELWSRAAHDLDARLEVAHLFFGLGDYDKAIEEYERILEEDPTRKIVYNMLGYIHAERGDFTSALQNLERYRELTPGEPNAHDSIGETLVLAGRLEEAAGHFQRALERWPQFVNSLMRLTQVYAELGDRGRALEYAGRWARIAATPRERSRALLTQAAVEWRFGDLAAAGAAIDASRAADRGSVAPTLLTYRMLRARGEERAARALAHDALAAFAAERDWSRITAGADAEQAIQLLSLGVRAELEPADLLPALEGASRSSVAMMRDMSDLLRGLVLLRAGEAERADAVLWAGEARLLDRLLARRYISRPATWRYVVEAVDRAPVESVPAIVAAAEAAGQGVERDDLRVLTRLVALQAEAKAGSGRELRRAYRELGLPLEEDWRIAGPFDNLSGYVRAFPPEPGAATGEGDAGAGAVTWRSGSDGVRDGYVDLARILGVSDWKVAYAQTRVVSPDRRVVQLRVGSDESCKLWLNGELVWQAYRKEYAGLDHDIVKVVLRPGENDLRIKVVNSLDEWGFYLRVTGEDGSGDPGVSFRPPQREQASAPAPAATPGRG